jgi:hypothetical protein
VLDATPINIAPLQYGSYDVVWNGGRFFVFWTDGRSFYYAFVGPDGVATPATAFYVPFPSPYDYAQTVSVAWDGRQYIVVYREVAPEFADGTATVAAIGVIRLTAAGVVLDPVPATISFGDADSNDGSVHVASSGSESLIVFDRDSGPVSVVLRNQGATLHLDPEVPLLHWQYGTSGVAWNGAAYVVAMHYGLGSSYGQEPGWLAEIDVGQSGKLLRTTFTPAAGLLYSTPSIANDLAAGTAFVSTEVTPQTYVPRARIYLLSEFSLMPAPPPAPRNAVSYFAGTTARIDWQSNDGGNGFLIERAYYDSWETYEALPADARTATVLFARIGDQFRIRAYGPGGFSEGTITTITSTQRRRAAGH